MSGFTYTTLKQAVLDYSEVDANVFTATILDQFIMNAEHRINLDLPMDSDRFVQEGQLQKDKNTFNSPAGALFIRGIEVFPSTTATTEQGFWLEKRDQTYLEEYVGRLTGPVGPSTGQDVTGIPEYYAMFGGAIGLTDTTSGGFYVAPTPDENYFFRIYYNKMPVGLGAGNATTYISNYFPQGLLYACLAEAFVFLKGPTDMLTLYEQKYNNEIQKFAGMQIGRRRRDDYTDGTIRIKIDSPSP
jgi:hypothetical protein